MSSFAKCRVCGKNYVPCRTAAQNGVFRWQSVACSPECGAEYLRRIEVSRAPKKVEAKPQRGKRAALPLFVNDSEGIAQGAATE